MAYRIYCYTNQITGQKYIGCTCRKYQSERARNGDGYVGHCPVFGDAIIEYGWDNFVYSVLEDNLTKEQSEVRERYWIDKLGTIYPDGYNLQSGGVTGRKMHQISVEKTTSKLRGRKWTEAQCQNQSKRLKGRPGTNKGRTFSNEWRHNISLGMKGHQTSEETRQRQSESNKGLKWYNDGTKNIKAYSCPEGYVPGMLKRR